MVPRSAIGATSAAAVIFSIILVSNAALFYASQDREALYSKSDIESSLNDSAVVLAGVGGATILLGVQRALESQTLGCSVAEMRVSSMISGLAYFQKANNVTVSVSARAGPEWAKQDNFSMLSPYNGSSVGDLNILLHIAANGENELAGVSYARNEVHVVHLPVHLESAVQDCLASVKVVAISAASITPANCTRSAVGAAMNSAEIAASAMTSSDGLDFAMRYNVEDGPSCSVNYWISVAQPDIAGPAGYFNLHLQEEASASFGRPSLSPPA